MKRNLFCVVILVIALFFSGCKMSVSGFTQVNFADYGKWDTDVQNVLDKFFYGILPSNDIVQAHCSSYKFWERQAILGDLNFYIIIDLQIESNDAYNDEIKRLEGIGERSEQEDTAFYIASGSDSEVLEYFDDETLDGLWFDFEIAVANKTDNTIKYMAAHIWDYNSPDDVSQFLQTVYSIEVD